MKKYVKQIILTLLTACTSFIFSYEVSGSRDVWVFESVAKRNDFL